MKTNIKQYRKHNQLNVDDEDHQITLSSAELASHEDILTEILLQLPIQSLLRSKCVSKHWQSLISNHRFALLRNPNPNPPLGLFLRRIADINPPKYDFVPFDRRKRLKPPFKTLTFHENGIGSNSGIVILHSSNGLMLCHSLHEYYQNLTKQIIYDENYYVYNPTINQFTILPKLHGCNWFQRRPRGLTLVFNPVKSPHYKIICVRGDLLSDNLYNIEIYSSENQTWRTSSKPFSNQIDTEFMCGVYWNDSVHWINKTGYMWILKIDECEIIQVPTPTIRQGWNVKTHCYPLIESCDCLLFIDMFPPFSLKFDIYEMSRDYSDWSVKYRVDLNETVEPRFRFVPVSRSFMVHCVVLGDLEEDSFVVLEVPGKVIRYNLVSKSYEELCDVEVSEPSRLSVADDGFSKVGRWPGAFLFFESLCHV